MFQICIYRISASRIDRSKITVFSRLSASFSLVKSLIKPVAFLYNFTFGEKPGVWGRLFQGVGRALNRGHTYFTSSFHQTHRQYLITVRRSICKGKKLILFIKLFSLNLNCMKEPSISAFYLFIYLNTILNIFHCLHRAEDG